MQKCFKNANLKCSQTDPAQSHIGLLEHKHEPEEPIEEGGGKLPRLLQIEGKTERVSDTSQ